MALCGSELVVSSPGVLQEEIRHPAPPATSCPTGPLYHCSQISISPAGCLEIPGERKKINAGPVPCTPLRFFIRSLSLLINFKICFRDLMSQEAASSDISSLNVSQGVATLVCWIQKRFLKNPVSWIAKRQYFCSISGRVGLKVKYFTRHCG